MTPMNAALLAAATPGRSVAPHARCARGSSPCTHLPGSLMWVTGNKRSASPATLRPPSPSATLSTAALAHATAAAGPGPAQPELALARAKLRRANQALADKDNLTADQLAQEAQLDALVAESRGETAKARLAAQEVQAAGRALADELARKTP